MTCIDLFILYSSAQHSSNEVASEKPSVSRKYMESSKQSKLCLYRSWVKYK